MIPPPPSSPLFPYTTLFRSHHLCAARGGARAGGHLRRHRVCRDPADQGARHSHGLGGARGDRKSTRLNSSHRCISYAVFCLKKKKLLIEVRSERKNREVFVG